MRARADDAIARIAADAFGVPADASIAFVKQRENVVYRVRAAGIDRSLRLHRPGYRTDAELESEVAAVLLFRAAGLIAPEPLSTPDGRVMVDVEHPQGRRQVTMQTWIDGGRTLGTSRDVFLGLARPSDREFADLGMAMARMHEVATAGAPVGYLRTAWDAEGLTGPRALWGDPTRLGVLESADRAAVRSACRRISGVLGAADSRPDSYGMIHADLTFENVLVIEGGLAVLDFDDSGAGWYLFDLATPYFWCTRHPDAEAILDTLVTGYRTVRTLAPDPATWHALLLARGLSYLGWATERPDDPASVFIRDDVVPWVLSAVRRYRETGDSGWLVPSRRKADNA